MESSNKLNLSLKHDLKVLNNISLEIAKVLPNFELNSWLFPTKSYKDVSESFLQNISNKKQYLGHLELMVDRLYLIINLLIKYIETFPTMAQKNQVRNIRRPINLSLGASINLLWKNMSHVNDAMIIENDKNFKILQNDLNQSLQTGTQTDTYSSDICTSCAMATSCIKQIIDEFEINLNARCTSQIRKELQENLYDITQYGCMYRLTSAIKEDVKHVIKHRQSLETQQKKSSTKLENLTIKYSESLNIIKNMESCLKNVQKRSRNAKLKNKHLLKELTELNQVNQKQQCQILQGREKIKTLEKSVEESTVSLALFSTDNEKLHQDIQNSLNDNINITSEKDLWKNRFSETYLENRCLEGKLKKQQAEIDDLKTIVNKISSDCEKLAIKLDRSNTKIIKKSETLEHFLKSSTVIPNAVKNAEAGALTVLKNSKHTLISYKITGDPVADMKRQVETNTFNIKKLEECNTDLLRTIQRVQEKATPMELINLV